MIRFLQLFFVVLFVLTAFTGGHYFGRRSTPRPLSDTVILSDTVYLTGPTIVKETPIPVPVDVDTAAILAAHFTQRVYTDEVISTPMVKVTVVDTVYQNSLVGRMAYSDIKIPVHSKSLSIGLTMAPQHTFVCAGYRRNRWEFLGGYDFINNAALMTAKYELFRW